MLDSRENLKAVEEVNIYEYPSPELLRDLQTVPGDQVAIGDLHGNAIKLIHFLVARGVMEIEKENYEKLVSIYQKNIEDITEEDILEFTKFLTSSKINKDRFVHLIGDELSDRGKCDLFTLLVFEKMQTEEVPFDILISNHGQSFLAHYQDDFETGSDLLESQPLALDSSQGESSYNLKKLINKNVVSLDRVKELVERSYKPALLAINYATTPGSTELKIFSHAPIDLNMIEALAKHYGVPYNEETKEELMATIDEINRLFRSDILSGRFLLHKDFSQETLKNIALGSVNPISLDYPLLAIAWNRGNPDLFTRLQPRNGKFNITYLHGHEGPIKREKADQLNATSHSPEMINLDSNFSGRDEKDSEGHNVPLNSQPNKPFVTYQTKEKSPAPSELIPKEPSLKQQEQMYYFRLSSVDELIDAIKENDIDKAFVKLIDLAQFLEIPSSALFIAEIQEKFKNAAELNHSVLFHVFDRFSNEEGLNPTFTKAIKMMVEAVPNYDLKSDSDLKQKVNSFYKNDINNANYFLLNKLLKLFPISRFNSLLQSVVTNERVPIFERESLRMPYQIMQWQLERELTSYPSFKTELEQRAKLLPTTFKEFMAADKPKKEPPKGADYYWVKWPGRKFETTDKMDEKSEIQIKEEKSEILSMHKPDNELTETIDLADKSDHKSERQTIESNTNTTTKTVPQTYTSIGANGLVDMLEKGEHRSNDSETIPFTHTVIEDKQSKESSQKIGQVLSENEQNAENYYQQSRKPFEIFKIKQRMIQQFLSGALTLTRTREVKLPGKSQSKIEEVELIPRDMQRDIKVEVAKYYLKTMKELIENEKKYNLVGTKFRYPYRINYVEHGINIEKLVPKNIYEIYNNYIRPGTTTDDSEAILKNFQGMIDAGAKAHDQFSFLRIFRHSNTQKIYRTLKDMQEDSKETKHFKMS